MAKRKAAAAKSSKKKATRAKPAQAEAGEPRDKPPPAPPPSSSAGPPPRAARISRGDKVLRRIQRKADDYDSQHGGCYPLGGRNPSPNTDSRHVREAVAEIADEDALSKEEVTVCLHLAQLLKEFRVVNATDLADALMSGRLPLDRIDLAGMVRGANLYGLPAERRESLVRQQRDRLTRMV